MKKYITLLILLLSASTSMHSKSLLLTLKGGTKVYYLLGTEKKTIMKFVDGELTVNADTYTISKIKNFQISDTDDPDAISDVKIPETMWKEGRFVIASGQGEVMVCNIAGQRMKVDVQQAEEFTSVDLSKLPKGTYIIQQGENSFKVQKR